MGHRATTDGYSWELNICWVIVQPRRDVPQRRTSPGGSLCNHGGLFHAGEHLPDVILSTMEDYSQQKTISRTIFFQPSRRTSPGHYFLHHGRVFPAEDHLLAHIFPIFLGFSPKRPSPGCSLGHPPGSSPCPPPHLRRAPWGCPHHPGPGKDTAPPLAPSRWLRAAGRNGGEKGNQLKKKTQNQHPPDAFHQNQAVFPQNAPPCH